MTYATLTLCYCLILYYSMASELYYKAAVVEYAPVDGRDYIAREIMDENAKRYIALIEEAGTKGAKIIVFPEYGLTSLEAKSKVKEHLDSFSVEIPKTTDSVSFCTHTSEKDPKFQILKKISCLAEKQKIYVVINFIEKETLPNSSTNYFSTSLVFDSKGIIKARYRKINLNKETNLNMGYETTNTFETDFGKFGILTGTDILFKNPAFELIKDLRVTNIVFSSSWNSEAPFLNGLSFQDGYSKGNNINLLAACISEPYYNNTGSGIFSVEGKNASIYFSSKKGTKLFIQDVPVLKKRTEHGCQEYGQEYNQPEAEKNFEENFSTALEDLQNYTSIPLDDKEKEHDEPHCSFKISVNTTVDPNYKYKLVSFFGSRYFGERQIAVCVCALVACLNDTSCGIRGTLSPAIKFKQISINATYLKLMDFSVQPFTLKYNLLPTINYKYCNNKNSSNGNTNVTLVITKEQESLLVFGFFCRIYEFDNKTDDEIRKAVEKNMTPISSLTNSDGVYIFWIAATILIIMAIIIISIIFRLIYVKKCKTHNRNNSYSSLQIDPNHPETELQTFNTN